MHQIISSIHNYIAKHNLLPHGSRVILGLSGGPDSVFLAHLLAQLHHEGKINLVAAHLNHEWRPNSQDDLKFCQDICSSLKIDLHAARASELCASFKFNGSQEEMGRRLRRHFFSTLAHTINGDRIVLAHHADDQQETFFIRMLRGASLAGLTGMKPIDGIYVRPLLTVQKQEIVAYLHTHAIAYLQDPTNDSHTYLRNRIRHTVIPALRTADTRFDQTFFATLDRLQETEDYLVELTQNVWATISIDNHQIVIDRLLSLHPAMQQRILVHWLCTADVEFTPASSFFNEMLRFLQQPGDAKHAVHHAWSIKKLNGFAKIVETT